MAEAHANTRTERVADAAREPALFRPTVSHMFGEIVWILSQSPLHKHFSIADLEWMVMPALLLEQYRVFKEGTRPIGAALWAFVNEEAEKKLMAGSARLRPDEWKSGDRCWLVELIAPFATVDNQMIMRMVADLGQISLKGQGFTAFLMEPSGARRPVRFGTPIEKRPRE